MLGSFGSSPKNVPIAVVNYDNGLGALKFVNTLQSGNNVEVISSTTQQQAMQLLSKGSVAAVVVIPNGFTQPSRTDGSICLPNNSQPQSTAVASADINAVASQFGVKATMSGISVTTNYAYGASSNYISFVVGGLLVMVVSFGAVFTAGFTMLSDRG